MTELEQIVRALARMRHENELVRCWLEVRDGGALDDAMNQIEAALATARRMSRTGEVWWMTPHRPEDCVEGTGLSKEPYDGAVRVLVIPLAPREEQDDADS